MGNCGMCILHSCVFAASQFSQKSCKCSHLGSRETLASVLWNLYVPPSPGRSPSLGPWRHVGDGGIYPRGMPPAHPFPFSLPASSFFFSSPLPLSWVLFFLYFYICLARWKDFLFISKEKSRCSKTSTVLTDVYWAFNICQVLRASHVFIHRILTTSLWDRNFVSPTFIDNETLTQRG